MDVHFTAADSYTLHASLYGDGNRDGIIVAPAMSVPRRYYDAFAQFAANAGFAVLVFDYRGFGKSRPEPLRQSKATMADWGALDIPAAIDFMRARDLRSLSLIGQSAGGQVAGLAPNLNELDRMVFVASQLGYWRKWPGWRAWQVLFLWLAMPVVARLIGFFPSRLVGLGSENLPRGVAMQWARWGRNPRYVLGFGSDLDLTNYTAFRKPLLAWSFEGDNLAPPRAVDALLAEYSGATIERRHVTDRGVGHFGYFRRGSESMWKETLEWLRPVSSRPRA